MSNLKIDSEFLSRAHFPLFYIKFDWFFIPLFSLCDLVKNVEKKKRIFVEFVFIIPITSSFTELYTNRRKRKENCSKWLNWIEPRTQFQQVKGLNSYTTVNMQLLCDGFCIVWDQPKIDLTSRIIHCYTFAFARLEMGPK